MREKMTTVSEMFPYAVDDMHGGFGPAIIALKELDLIHLTDYLYWRNKMRFKDESNATMYKLMQDT
jgi:hypothetical protein